jgi:hypothetical protein
MDTCAVASRAVAVRVGGGGGGVQGSFALQLPADLQPMLACSGGSVSLACCDLLSSLLLLCAGSLRG